MKPKTKKKKNPQDLTLRNLKAMKKDMMELYQIDNYLIDSIKILHYRIQTLESAFTLRKKKK